ncbi:MAG: tetratricopeptide (TPR) repeat protein [Sulfurimonas sp.]|jgi:tetratricopeptide (TPR) repeat protein
MLNINELESRWYKYKLKSYIPYVVITISISIIVILFFTIYNSEIFFYNTNKLKKPVAVNIIEINKQEVPIVIKKQEEHNTTIKIEKEELVKEDKTNNSKTLMLSPSLGFMTKMQQNSMSYYEKEDAPVKRLHKPISKPIIKKEAIPVKIPVEIQKVKKVIVQKSIININRQNAQKDIAHVIARFKKNNNPALSLFIAKKYYELQNYNQSYNYALMTNAINDNIDASWIIFTKSLVKLNKKDEAIKTLTKYIKYSHSNQAKILLEEISSGKFK